jgi:hypothetical protein
MSLHSDLAGISGDNDGRELDLKSLNKTDPLFMHEVARDSQLLYGSHYNYIDYKLHAAARYDDNKLIFELESIQTKKCKNVKRQA